MLEAVIERMPYTIVEVSGSPYERGFAYGSLMKDSLKRFLQREFYERWKDMKKDMLLFGGKCLDEMRDCLPKATEFLRGLSNGSGLSMEEAVMMQCHEEFVHGIEMTGHCSAIAIAPTETADGRTYVGQNWDWITSMNEYKLLLRQRTSDDLRILTYAFGGLWCGAGMNSAGIALTWTSAYKPKRPGEKKDPGKAEVGVPTYALIAEVLEQKDLSSAVDLIMKVKNAGWFIFVLASADGGIVEIEACPNFKVKAQSRSFIVAAHGVYQTDKMRLYFGFDPERELPPFDAGISRLSQLLMIYSGQITPELLMRFLASHLPSEKMPDVNAVICEHGIEHATLDSMLFCPSSGECWFTPGPPCQHKPIKLKV